MHTLHMKYIGIDYGLKKIGLATSNDDGSVAFPHCVIQNNPGWITKLLEIAEETSIDGGIVFGESKDLSMKENPLMQDVHKAVEEIGRKSDLPTHLHPEFMTSREANRFIEENEMHDARAAALILQHFLDAQNKQK